MGFKKKTIETVIVPLVMKLQKNTGKVYHSLGEFHREIELLKFPFLGRWESKVNVYSQQQYETILCWLINHHLVSVNKDKRNHQVTVNGFTKGFLKTRIKNDFGIELEDFLNAEDIVSSNPYYVDIKPLEMETPKEKIYTESEVIALFKKFTNDILGRGNEQWLQKNLK